MTNRLDLGGESMISANVFLRQILPNSAAQFVKFREILRRYCPQVPIHSAASWHCCIN